MFTLFTEIKCEDSSTSLSIGVLALLLTFRWCPQIFWTVPSDEIHVHFYKISAENICGKN